MPPDRPDRNLGDDPGRVEVVDVFGKEDVTVDTGTGTDDMGVDHNSSGEGDARSMASEGEGDAGTRDGDGASRIATRRQVRATGGDDSGDGSYSERVRKRIARERGVANRERTLREQTQRQLAAERTARQAQDERIARLERASTEVAGNADAKAIEGKIEALKPQIAAAMEAGETAKVLELQDKLADLKADLRILQYDLKQKQRAAETSSSRTTTQAAAEETTTEDPVIKNLVDSFVKANRHWWNRTANKDARADAISIDKEILAELAAGELDFEKYSDEHFAEMAARLHETYPDLEIQDLEGQPYEFDEESDDVNDQDGGRGNRGDSRQQQRAGGRGAAPVNRMGHNGRRGPTELELARQGKVTLDQKDFQTMRLFKMDPNNPTDKKYFAKEKMRSVLSGQRSAEGNR